MSNENSLYQELKLYLQEKCDGELTLEKLADITEHAMEVVETLRSFKDLQGGEKKELVLKLVGQLVEEFGGDNEGYQVMLSVLPYVIDATVAFAKIYHDHKKSGRRFLCC